MTTIFVTHDQEEAMDVAEQIIVMNDGKVEQSGGPRDLYEHPASEFVMGFVGPAHRLGEAWVRPHDVEVLHEPNGQTIEALVDRIVHLGFEVRVELTLAGRRALLGAAHPDQVDELELKEGQIVFVRPRAEPDVQRRTAARQDRAGGRLARGFERGAERAGEPTTGSRRRGRRLARTPGFCRLAQLPHLGRQLACDHVGEGHLVHHRAQVGAQRDPDLLQRLRLRPCTRGLRALAPNRRQRPLDRADDVREDDLVGRLRQPVAALRAAPAGDDPDVLELAEDVLEELERDLLRLGDRLALDRLSPAAASSTAARTA